MSAFPSNPASMKRKQLPAFSWDDQQLWQSCEKIVKAGTEEAFLDILSNILIDEDVNLDQEESKKLAEIFSSLVSTKILSDSSMASPFLSIIFNNFYALALLQLPCSNASDQRFVKTQSSFLKKNSGVLEFDESVASSVYKVLVVKCVKLLETGVKSSDVKKLLKVTFSSLRSLPARETALSEILEFVLSFPIMVAARWDVLEVLLTSELLTPAILPKFVVNELKACASNQKCCVRCSQFVVALSTSDPSSAAELVLSCLNSPSSSTRHNVARAWVARMVRQPETRTCIQLIVDAAKNNYLAAKTSSPWPLKFRQLQEFSSMDLEWKEDFLDDAHTDQQLALIAYAHVFIALAGGGSQLRLEMDSKLYEAVLELNDSVALEIRSCVIRFVDKSVTTPLQLVAIGRHIGDPFQYSNKVEEEKCSTEVEDLVEEPLAQFYPIDKHSNLHVLDNLPTEPSTSLHDDIQRYLDLQSTSMYPTVAEVMKNFKQRNIDERAFVAKFASFLRSFTDGDFEKEVLASALFYAISKCPFRSFVDYTGKLVADICQKDELFNDRILEMALELLAKKEENSRALVFEKCLNASIRGQPERFARAWDVVKNTDSSKQSKMFEMFANIVSNSSTNIEWSNQEEILFASLGLLPGSQSSCPKLHVAICLKMFGSHSEVDRTLLFVKTHNQPRTFGMLEKLASALEKVVTTDVRVAHLSMIFLSRFHFVVPNFYNFYELNVIENVRRLIHAVIERWRHDQLVLSAAVDAFCGFHEWDALRESLCSTDMSYTDAIEDTSELLTLEKLFLGSLTAHPYWKNLHDTLKVNRFASGDAVKELPIWRIIENALLVVEKSDEIDFEADTRINELFERVDSSMTYYEINASLLALSIVGREASKRRKRRIEGSSCAEQETTEEEKKSIWSSEVMQKIDERMDNLVKIRTHLSEM